ncbi:hypothetical protein [Granulicoccus phenolivorans]|uniref:hypothetical protein n=1 Tax=Granulicoccus phenolivorans TaxID=266854 RepID=UPI00040391C4|nr:hypothetical protein [Granulicoccus phenolivorans]
MAEQTPPAGSTDPADLARAVAALTARVEALETQIAALRGNQEIPEDVIIAISAAVSAYLGNRARVKAVRFQRDSSTWAAQGRQRVQSHEIARS